MFFRDCAFFMRLYGDLGTYNLWSFAVFSVGITVGNFVLLIAAGALVLFPLALPAHLHPLTAGKEVRLIEILAVFATVAFSVEICLRRFKHDVSEARRYMRTSDLVKWWLTTLFTAASLVGTVLLIIEASKGPLPK